MILSQQQREKPLVKVRQSSNSIQNSFSPLSPEKLSKSQTNQPFLKIDPDIQQLIGKYAREVTQSDSSLITTMFHHPKSEGSQEIEPKLYGSYVETYQRAFSLSSGKKTESPIDEDQPHNELKRKLDEIYDRIHTSVQIIKVNTRANPPQLPYNYEVPSPISPKMATMTNEICTDRIASPYDLLCADMNEKTHSFQEYHEAENPQFSQSSISNNGAKQADILSNDITEEANICAESSQQPEIVSPHLDYQENTKSVDQAFMDVDPNEQKPEEDWEEFKELGDCFPKVLLNTNLSVIEEEEEFKQVAQQDTDSAQNDLPIIDKLNGMLSDINVQLQQSKLTYQQAKKIEEIRIRHGPRRNEYQDLEQREQPKEEEHQQRHDQPSMTLKAIEIMRNMLISILMLMIVLQIIVMRNS